MILFSLLSLAGCGGHLTPKQLLQLQAAEDRFEQSSKPTDFAAVAADYQQIIADGVRSGPLFYNLGNAYTKANQRGHAIAAYRQAQRYLPANPQLADSLSRAVGSAAAQQRSIWSYFFFWQDWISYPGKFSLTTWIAAIALLLGIIRIFDWRQRWAGRGGLVALLLAAAVGVSALYDWYRFDKCQHGVVVQEATARKGNGDSYEPAFTKPLVDGTEFSVVEQRRDWIRVQLGEDASEGWLPADSVVVY